jgi:hypothetical protein
MLAGSLLRDLRLSIVISPREDVERPFDPYAEEESLNPRAETEPLDTE